MNHDPSPTRRLWLRWESCLRQHLVLGVVAYGIYRLFFWSKTGLPAGHQVNRSWADASTVFLCASLLPGPLGRLWPAFRRLIPWRRDLGLWFALTALIHVGLLLQLQKWDVLRFFLDKNGQLAKAAANASNWVGLVALGLVAVLAATSNRLSESILGGAAWKFIQQSAYDVFLLSMLHAFIFVYLVDGRESALFAGCFWTGAALVCGFQLWGVIHTVRAKRARADAHNA